MRWELAGKVFRVSQLLRSAEKITQIVPRALICMIIESVGVLGEFGWWLQREFLSNYCFWLCHDDGDHVNELVSQSNFIHARIPALCKWQMSVRSNLWSRKIFILCIVHSACQIHYQGDLKNHRQIILFFSNMFFKKNFMRKRVCVQFRLETKHRFLCSWLVRSARLLQNT